ncbi:hypothetical protein LB518_09930 [Mesorhizobium sp. BR1-1-16]|uniref:hypothetical protein n=1 Tax=Mesorhizobium sp. BR1-1-16 TaxID=2876653 RepID=UPI001CCC98E5|nr:hypothetical protein [Mesorhizobium sp. BR1-1-16]MBZ9936614.1 hypothetical protein [Mesorhizobium sp. BR1-1-16]
MVAFLISICLMTVVTAIMHILLGRWGVREQARIAAMRRAAAPSPSLATPEPDEDQERHEIRMHSLLDEITADMKRRGGMGFPR